MSSFGKTCDPQDRSFDPSITFNVYSNILSQPHANIGLFALLTIKFSTLCFINKAPRSFRIYLDVTLYDYVTLEKQCLLVFVCLFCCFTSQVNSYGHGRTVSSLNHTYFWASL